MNLSLGEWMRALGIALILWTGLFTIAFGFLLVVRWLL